MRNHLSTQHYTAHDAAEAERRFATLDLELEQLRAGLETPSWYARKVATREPTSLEFEHRSTARDGFVYCESRIYDGSAHDDDTDE